VLEPASALPASSLAAPASLSSGGPMFRQWPVVHWLSDVHVVHEDGLFALFVAKSNLQLQGVGGA
jgi:hypothetical protein